MEIDKEIVEYFYKKLGVDITQKKERIELCRISFKAYCLIYLTHYFSLSPAKFHKDLIRILEDESEEEIGIIGFRGSAKTTICAVAFMCWCVCYSKYRFPLLVNDTVAQVKINILNIRKEFEENELIRRDFPKTVLEKESLFSETKLEFKNLGILIFGRSRGQKVRGLRYRQFRPDFILCDDLEDLEWVRKKENRDKTERWYKSELVPAQEELKCKMIVIGNLLHKDALMMRLKNQGTMRFFIFPLIDKNGNVTWRAKYPDQKSLDKKKAKVGITAWSREYLLKIVAEDDQVVKETDIHYYPNSFLTTLDKNGELIIEILDSGVGNDLAIGQKEENDFVTFVSGLKVKLRENKGEEYEGTKIFIKPRPVNAKLGFEGTIKKAKSIQEVSINGTKFYVEGVAYQKSAIEIMKKNGIPVYPMNPTTDKKARLETVSPFIIDGTVMFPETGCEDLIEQLVNFGIEEHDDLCLVAGTKILTPYGEKNIEDIKVGDKVITPLGIRKVLVSKETGISEIITIDNITGTKNHPIFTEKGFISLDAIGYIKDNKDTSIFSLYKLIEWRYKKLLYSMESSINCSGKENIILVSQQQIEEEKILKDFTLRFGNFIIKKEYLKAITFTIKTVILLIIILKIWKQYQLMNTLKCQKILIKKKWQNILRKLDRLQINGISRKKEEKNTVRCLKNNGKTQRLITKYANIAVLVLKHFIKIQSAVQKDVLQGDIEKCTQKKSKKYKKDIIKKEKVYNLLIDKDNVYYANGILVGNCDALVYLIMGIIKRRVFKKAEKPDKI